MFLRINAGSLKGRTFDGPKGGKTVRPISDRVKEAVFDILAARVPDAMVLDLFSGTGAIAFECISRGAQKTVSVEYDKRNVALIKKNAASLGILDQVAVLHGELPQALKKVRGSFDLIFLDPPFASDIGKDLFPLIHKRKLLVPDGVIVFQRDRRSAVISSVDFHLDRSHKIGDSVVYFYKHPPETTA